MFETAGFRRVEYFNSTGGIVAVHARLPHGITLYFHLGGLSDKSAYSGLCVDVY